MSRTLLCSAALLCACTLGAGAPAAVPGLKNSPILTIVLDIKRSHYSASSFAAMETETQRIFNNTGIKLDWRIKSELPEHAEFNNVVVFTMTGFCTMNDSPELIDERGPLALTYTSDGEILPFGEVRCDRVRASLKRHARSAVLSRPECVFGIALGRVMAHELYHMLAEEARHTDGGVTRTSLLAEDLIEGNLDFDSSAVSRMGTRIQRAELPK